MPSAISRLNVALAGLGRMGAIYAQTIVEDLPQAYLMAVVDPDPDARAAVQARYHVPHATADLQDVLGLPDLDAVIVASPTHTHRAVITTAAASGMAVFTEKPLAITLDDTHAVIQAVEEAGVTMQVGFMRRFDDAYLRAKEMIDTGRIGEPVLFKAIGRDLLCPRPEFADPARSGGLITDMGIHDMDLARWMMNSEVVRVTAEATLLVCDDLAGVGDDDIAVINLRFESGAVGNVDLSRNAVYGYDLRTEVLGSRGLVRVGSDHVGMLLSADVREEQEGTYLMERFGKAYRAQLRHFVECVREGTRPAVIGDDALAAFEICLAATRAAQTGLPVTLESIRQEATAS